MKKIEQELYDLFKKQGKNINKDKILFSTFHAYLQGRGIEITKEELKEKIKILQLDNIITKPGKEAFEKELKTVSIKLFKDQWELLKKSDINFSELIRNRFEKIIRKGES